MDPLIELILITVASLLLFRASITVDDRPFDWAVRRTGAATSPASGLDPAGGAEYQRDTGKPDLSVSFTSFHI